MATMRLKRRAGGVSLEAPTREPELRQSAWSVETVRHDNALRDLGEEWEDLYRRSSLATPFQSHAWLNSWWENYGRPGGLRVSLVRRDGRLVAAAALARTRRLGLPVLVAVGRETSDLMDVLVADDCAREATIRLAGELRAVVGRGVLDLPDVPADSVLGRVAGSWRGPRWILPGAMCLELPALTSDELVSTLPAARAKQVRKKNRKIESAGVEVRSVGADDAARAVRDLLALHRVQWRGRGMTPEHARSRFGRHLADAAAAMVRRGQAAIISYHLGGRVVAVELFVVGHAMVGGYLYGISPELRRLVDVEQLRLWPSLALARRLGRPTLTFLRGDEPHKRVWDPTERRSQRVILAGRSSPGSGCTRWWCRAGSGSSTWCASGRQGCTGRFGRSPAGTRGRAPSATGCVGSSTGRNPPGACDAGGVRRRPLWSLLVG